MEYRIEGNDISAEITATQDGMKNWAIIRLNGGEWTITVSTGTRWLARGSVATAEAIRRAMVYLAKSFEPYVKALPSYPNDTHDASGKPYVGTLEKDNDTDH